MMPVGLWSYMLSRQSTAINARLVKVIVAWRWQAVDSSAHIGPVARLTEISGRLLPLALGGAVLVMATVPKDLSETEQASRRTTFQSGSNERLAVRSTNHSVAIAIATHEPPRSTHCG